MGNKPPLVWAIGTLKFTAVILAGLAAMAPTPAFSLEAARRAQDFVDSIGVGVHTMYTDGGYANLDGVLACLDYLGVRSLRDAAPRADASADRRYGKIAAHGMRFDVIVHDDPAGTVARLENFLARYPGAIEAVEGPNEVNNWPVTFAGATGPDGAVAFQRALFAAVKASSSLRQVPVYNFTDDPQPAGDADYANLHPYPRRGAQPFGVLREILSADALPMPGKPRVITEAGYAAMPDPSRWQGSDGWGPVDEQSQAILTTNLLLDAYALGAPRTYLYQLLDAYADPKANDADKHLGLFDLAYRPKPAATAIRNLIALLADGDAASRNFAVGRLPMSVRGLPPAGHVMTLEKADGTYIVILWNEAAIWDAANRRATRPADIPVTLDLGPARRGVAVYDPVASQAATERMAQAGRVEIRLAERPVVVFLTADGASAGE